LRPENGAEAPGEGTSEGAILEDSPEKGPIDVYDVIGMMLQQSIELSWQKLGLQPDFMTGRIETDLVQAKVMIDVASHLADTAIPQLDDADRRTVQNSIRDLKVNYVQRVGGQS